MGEAEGGDSKERDSEIQQTVTHWHMQSRVVPRMCFIHSKRGAKRACTTCMGDGSVWDMLQATK